MEDAHPIWQVHDFPGAGTRAEAVPCGAGLRLSIEAVNWAVRTRVEIALTDEQVDQLIASLAEWRSQMASDSIPMIGPRGGWRGDR